ncbi:MlaD family protein [Mycobacteroides chelonae]|uniref:MlaD family protein n=1 Tax=Mycobacteroides chelonae TaxID=1774 RepID=UPI0008A9D431|nr:hypothetical protein BKG85_12090 [Mycobacteroides chelonae]
MPRFHDESGRSASGRALLLRGLIVLAALALVSTALYRVGTGTVSKPFALTLITRTLGEGLAPGAEVKFRGFTIGSVKSLESAGYNKQRMTVILDPEQATALTNDTRAQFTSSNIFGTAAVELLCDGMGGPLVPNRTLEIAADVQAASITGVLRQADGLSGVLDSPEFKSIFDALQRNTSLTSPVLKSIFDVAKTVSDAQTVPFSRSLSVIAAFTNGFEKFIPSVAMSGDLMDRLTFLEGPGGGKATRDIINQVARIALKASDAFARNSIWTMPFANSLLDLLVPFTYALGSIAPAYDRLSGLLDRTGSAFPQRDGRIRMQIQLYLDAAPGLAAALPPAGAQPPGGHQ